jgi:DNA-binding LacI/PurR family transcriptional regulator
MNAGSLFFMAEDDYLKSSWYADTLHGIQSEIKNNDLNVTLLRPDSKGFKSVHAGDFVLVFGLSESWTDHTIHALGQANARVILISLNPPDMPTWISCIRIDRNKSVQTLVHSFSHYGRKQIALWGIDPRSISDTERTMAFLSSSRKLGLPVNRSDIYLNNDSLSDCYQSFKPYIKQYNSVICANDIAALFLMSRLKEEPIAIPGDMFVAGSGNTATGRLTTPSLTTVTLNFREAGQRAVDMALYLDKTPGLVSVTATVNCQIILRESTGNMKIRDTSLESIHIKKTDPIGFYADPDVDEITQLDRLMNAGDEIDRSILRGVLKEFTSEQIAEWSFVSMPSLKRRLHKLLEITNTNTKAELRDLMIKYGITRIPDDGS